MKKSLLLLTFAVAGLFSSLAQAKAPNPNHVVGISIPWQGDEWHGYRVTAYSYNTNPGIAGMLNYGWEHVYCRLAQKVSYPTYYTYKIVYNGWRVMDGATFIVQYGADPMRACTEKYLPEQGY